MKMRGFYKSAAAGGASLATLGKAALVPLKFIDFQIMVVHPINFRESE
jgi:hypothetical protein